MSSATPATTTRTTIPNSLRTVRGFSTSQRLLCDLQRQLFLLSYLMTRSVGPTVVWTHKLRLGSPLVLYLQSWRVDGTKNKWNANCSVSLLLLLSQNDLESRGLDILGSYSGEERRTRPSLAKFIATWRNSGIIEENTKLPLILNIKGRTFLPIIGVETLSARDTFSLRDKSPMAVVTSTTPGGMERSSSSCSESTAPDSVRSERVSGLMKQSSVLCRPVELEMIKGAGTGGAP